MRAAAAAIVPMPLAQALLSRCLQIWNAARWQAFLAVEWTDAGAAPQHQHRHFLRHYPLSLPTVQPSEPCVSFSGIHIKYWDDSGFAAADDFVEPDVLHHSGVIFYRT